MRRLLKKLAKINETLCVMARNLAGLFLVAMIVIVIMQIFFRYVLNDSLIWTEELAKTLMVWTAFLVAPWAYRAGANVRIGFLIDEFPKKFQTIMRLILNFLIIWIVTVFFYESFGFWQRGLTVRADSLPIQVAWFYSIVPIAFMLLLLTGIEMILRNILSIFYPAEDFEISQVSDLRQFE